MREVRPLPIDRAVGDGKAVRLEADIRAVRTLEDVDDLHVRRLSGREWDMAGNRLVGEDLARLPVEHLGLLLAQIIEVDTGDPADDRMRKEVLEARRIFSVSQMYLGEGLHHHKRVTVGRRVLGNAGDGILVVEL